MRALEGDLETLFFLLMVGVAGGWIVYTLAKPMPKRPARRRRKRRPSSPAEGCDGALDRLDHLEPFLSRPEKWALALAAPLGEVRGDGFELLYPNHNRSCLLRSLSNGWGVEGTEEVREMLRWLLEEGHEEEFQAHREGAAPASPRGKFVSRHPHVKTIRAWDLGRLVCVARWAYAVNFIDRAEAWQWIYSAARVAKIDYDSWSGYGEGYMHGYDFWALHGGGDAEQGAVVRRLKEDPRSLWAALPWELEITGGDPEVPG